MNILVTGGAGFIGTNLIKKLKKESHNIVSVDNYSTGKKENHIENVKYIELDVSSFNEYSRLGEFDIVYHLAAIARIQPSFERPDEYFQTNCYGTLKLAHFCSNNNIPLVYAGSSSHHSGRFKNPYTFSKDIGEEIIVLFQTHYNLKASIARFYNVYGPNQLTEGNYSTVIGKWIKRKEENLPLTIFGDGSKRRDFTHVDDIVEALMLIPEKSAWGELFELGTGKNYSILEVAKMYNHPYIFESDKPGEALETLCNSKAARTRLGWIANRTLENYIEEYFK